MKYLVLALALAAAFWWIRSNRSEEVKRKQSPPATPPPRLAMVCCPHCGVHLPQADAVQGKLALYCSEAHRDAAEQA